MVPADRPLGAHAFDAAVRIISNILGDLYAARARVFSRFPSRERAALYLTLVETTPTVRCRSMQPSV